MAEIYQNYGESTSYLENVLITNIQSAENDLKLALASLATKDCYKDVRLECKNGSLWGVRVILALAYPFMADLIRDREQQKELVLLLPDFTVEEVDARLEEFLAGRIKQESSEEDNVDEKNVEMDLDGTNGTLASQTWYCIVEK